MPTCRFALQAQAIELHIDITSEGTYNLDMADIDAQPYLTRVNIISIAGGTGPLWPTMIQITSNGASNKMNDKHNSLELHKVQISGNLNLACNSDSLHLVLDQVTINGGTSTSTSIINIQKCDTLEASIKNSYIYNTLISFKTAIMTDLSIMNSAFSGLSSGNASTGIYGTLYKRDSQHNIIIVNSSFSHMGIFPETNEEPMGAIALLASKDNIDLKFKVMDSVFQENRRAIDLSMKGSSDVQIIGTTFEGNEAGGSGGAIRLTATLRAGFGSLTIVDRAVIHIDQCTFTNNHALGTHLYSESDVYYQTRSSASGGAIYVFLKVPSLLPHDGIVSVHDSYFSNNTGRVQGGTIFVNPDISAEIIGCNMSNSDSGLHAKFGDLIQSSCNMTIKDTRINVASSDGTTPIVSYQASDPSNARLLVEGLHMVCPTGFWVEELSTASLATSGSIEAIQMYCRSCPTQKYSLGVSEMFLTGTEAHIQNGIICADCPYGADCNLGIWNQQGFWGSSLLHGKVDMYLCPEDYCDQDTSKTIAFNACADHRDGVLCGRCKDGYSESMFGAVCIENSQCGWHNWYIALALALYGIFYLLFFMFENDYARFVRWISLKFKKKEENVDMDAQADAVDFSQAGYFQSFMYFIQTSALLKVEIVMREDAVYQHLHRPQDILPSWITDGFKEVFSFDILSFHANSCLFPSLTPVLKTALKLLLVLYLYLVMLLLYLFSCGCCFWMTERKRPKIGSLTMHARIVSTVIALFLYTYQSVAEDAFLLLNCTTVNGRSVLFFDGNETCLQDWQYGVIGFVAIFIIPFFILLLFGPKLLREGQINTPFFFFSMVFPLFTAIPLILIYFGCFKRRSKPLPDENDDKVYCCGKRSNNRQAALDVVTGPYRDDVLGGLCWEGVINLRRMIMVICFTFINDRLLKQMALSFCCFVILLIHLKSEPFVQRLSNHTESISLALLVVISGTNLVKAAFFHSQTIPQGENYLIMVLYEWVEVAAMGFLPLAILVIIIIAMIAKTGSLVLSKTFNAGAEEEEEEKTDGNDGHYVSKASQSFEKATPPYINGIKQQKLLKVKREKIKREFPSEAELNPTGVWMDPHITRWNNSAWNNGCTVPSWLPPDHNGEPVYRQRTPPSTPKEFRNHQLLTRSASPRLSYRSLYLSKCSSNSSSKPLRDRPESMPVKSHTGSPCLPRTPFDPPVSNCGLPRTPMTPKSKRRR